MKPPTGEGRSPRKRFGRRALGFDARQHRRQDRREDRRGAGQAPDRGWARPGLPGLLRHGASGAQRAGRNADGRAHGLHEHAVLRGGEGEAPRRGRGLRRAGPHLPPRDAAPVQGHAQAEPGGVQGPSAPASGAAAPHGIPPADPKRRGGGRRHSLPGHEGDGEGVAGGAPLVGQGPDAGSGAGGPDHAAPQERRLVGRDLQRRRL